MVVVSNHVQQLLRLLSVWTFGVYNVRWMWWW